jgi:hypothetical protein
MITSASGCPAFQEWSNDVRRTWRVQTSGIIAPKKNRFSVGGEMGIDRDRSVVSNLAQVRSVCLHSTAQSEWCFAHEIISRLERASSQHREKQDAEAEQCNHDPPPVAVD